MPAIDLLSGPIKRRFYRMVVVAKELKKMGNVSKRRLQSYGEYIHGYRKYKAEKMKLLSNEIKHEFAERNDVQFSK
jgi:hypothetical protein